MWFAIVCALIFIEKFRQSASATAIVFKQSRYFSPYVDSGETKVHWIVDNLSAVCLVSHFLKAMFFHEKDTPDYFISIFYGVDNDKIRVFNKRNIK